MPEEDLDRVVDFTNQVLRSSGLDLNAKAQTTDEGPKVEVRGDDVALLLGHNAELLDALEYLGNRIVARASGEDAKIIFDSGGYRARREKELQLMAEKAAERVRSSRIPFSFDGLMSLYCVGANRTTSSVTAISASSLPRSRCRS